MHLFVHSSYFYFDNFHSVVKWFALKHIQSLTLSRNLANNKSKRIKLSNPKKTIFTKKQDISK